MKKEFDAANAMYPFPVVLVTTHDGKGKHNIITVAWTTNVSRNAPCIGLSMGSGKLSFQNIQNSREFVVNIPGHNLLEQVDFCGESHGEEVDKFAATGLTAQKASTVGAKLIKQCPINLECMLKEIYRIEGANLIIGQIRKVHMDPTILDEQQKIDYHKLDPIVYAQKTYYRVGKAQQKRGFSKHDQ